MNTALSTHAHDSEQSAREEISPEPQRRFISRRLRLTFVIVYLLIGLGFRLSSIRSTAPHPDEEHWLHRSSIFLERLDAGEASNSTTHMGHPGIPAAVTMAVGVRLSESWNEFMEAEPYSRFYIDPLSAARIAVVLVSSLVFLVLILFSSDLLGFTAVLLATMFLALDCQHIALTRIAHIDGMLTLLATACLLLDFSAERSGSVPRKLGAGVLWGLAIATKPTAAALPGIFLAYKFFRRVCCRRFTPKPLPLLQWSDFWAVIVGHVVLASIYTKLWRADNTYVTKHHILPPLSDWFLGISASISAHSLFAPSLTCLLMLTAISLVRSPKTGLRFHLQMLCFTLCFLTLVVSQAPILSGNLVRFWYWVAGLSRRNHEAYGMVWSVPGWGYPENWLRRIPSLVIVGILPAIYFLMRRVRRISSRFEAEQTALLLALAAAPIIWTIPLSISNKQTIRYVAPMFPAAFLFSAWGFVELWRWMSVRIREHTRSQRIHWIPPIFALGAAALQASVAFSWAPNYGLYFNGLTGGVTSAFARGYVLSAVGYERALSFVHEKAKSSENTQRVEIVGDIELMRFAYARMYQKETRRRVKLDLYRDGRGADWVLEFPSVGRRRDVHLDDRNEFRPVLQEIEHGATVYTLYEVIPPPYEKAEEIAISNGNQRMGVLREFGLEGPNVIASPKEARAGFIYFNQYLRLRPGKYATDFSAALLPEAAQFPLLAPEEEVMRIELSSECSRVVLKKELDGYKLQPLRLECAFANPARAQLSVYWFGRVPVRLGNIRFQKINSPSPE